MRFVGVGEKDDELFAAVAGDELVDAGCLAEKLCDLAQGVVAGVVAKAVVVLLEVVDVEEDDGERVHAVTGGGERGGEAVIEGPAVGETGEGVGGGEFAQFGVGLLELGLIALELVLPVEFFGHVDRDAAEEDGAVFGGAGELIGTPGDGCAVGLEGDFVHDMESAGADDVEVVAAILVGCFFGKDIVDREPDPLCWGDAEALSHETVVKDEAAFGVLEEGHEGRAIHEVLKEVLLSAEPDVGLLCVVQGQGKVDSLLADLEAGVDLLCEKTKKVELER